MRKKKSQRQIDEEAGERFISREQYRGNESSLFTEWCIFMMRVTWKAAIRYERSRVKRAKKGRG